MLSILMPLIYYLCAILFYTKSLNYIKGLLSSLRSSSTQINQFYVVNLNLSLIIVITYVKVFILFMYFFRLYNMHRILDLKLLWNTIKLFLQKLTFLRIDLLLTLSLSSMLLLSVIMLVLHIAEFHKRIYKEIYNILLYFVYNNYLKKNKYSQVVLQYLGSGVDGISNQNIIQYIMNKLTHNITIHFEGESYDYIQLPWYHIRKLYGIIFLNAYYERIFNVSPLLVIIYDCIWNNFVLINVYYYLLLYIPIKLLERMTHACGLYAPYITDLVWEINYSKTPILYAIAPRYKPFLDQYITSGLRRNFDLGINFELYLYDQCRFMLNDKERKSYYNIHHVELQKIDGKYFEMREDDEGNSVMWEEWYVLDDKTHRFDPGRIKNVFTPLFAPECIPQIYLNRILS